MLINALSVSDVLVNLEKAMPAETVMILPGNNGIMVFDRKSDTLEETDIKPAPSMIGVIYFSKKSIPSSPRIGIFDDKTKHTTKDVDLLLASVTFGNTILESGERYKIFKSELSVLDTVLVNKTTDESKQLNHDILLAMLSRVLTRVGDIK